jgi:hypothetical protein
MNAFGDISFPEPATGEAEPRPTNGARAAGAPPETIDVNDPRLTSEVLEINPNADAFARVPALPDGKYRIKARARKAGDPPADYAAKKDDRSGAVYLYTALDGEVIDHQTPEFDGVPVSDFFLDTRIGRTGTSRVATLITRLNGKLPDRATHKALIDMLLGLLAAEPEVGIETTWEASCQVCEDTAKARGDRKPRPVQGMHNFPTTIRKDAAGKNVQSYSNQIPCPINRTHGMMTARPRIINYLSLEELKRFGK